MLIIGILLVLVRAAPPECASLFGGDGAVCLARQATVWVEAAEEEAVRFFHTVNGGWLAADCVPGDSTVRVPPAAVDGASIVCIDRWDIPKTRCHSRNCNFDSQRELFEGDCVPEKDRPKRRGHGDDDDDDRKDKKAACRSFYSWSKIASNKLAQALTALESNSTAEAISLACAADFLFGHLNRWLLETTPNGEEKLVFINDKARDTQHYRFVNSALRRGTVVELELDFELRVVQSSRTCTRSKDGKKKARGPRGNGLLQLEPGEDLPADDVIFQSGLDSVLLFSNFSGPGQNVTPHVDVVWAPGGLIPPFAGTLQDSDPTNRCARDHADTNLERFDPERRLAFLHGKDWVDVRNDGAPRHYLSLVPTASCPAPVLLQNVQTNTSATSVAQLELRNMPTPVQPTAAQELIEPQIFVRSATPDDCSDFVPLFFDAVVPGGDNSTNTTGLARAGSLGFNAAFRAPPQGVPLTLPPGESRCIGGDRAGAQCTMMSECGTGLACRRKPFEPREVAFCYDGEDWDESQPCAFADEDEECPFGYCFGEATDNAGGAYPLLYFYQENECQRTSGAKSAVCSEPHVASWFQYPNVGAFGSL